MYSNTHVTATGPVAAYAAEFASDEVWPVLLADGGEPLPATPGAYVYASSSFHSTVQCTRTLCTQSVYTVLQPALPLVSSNKVSTYISTAVTARAST
jgi:hypothetical protein